MSVREGKSTSIFSHIGMAPDDPIYCLTERFEEDPRKSKVNLGVGTYKDSEGHPTVLTVVEKAEKRLLKKKRNKDYLPMVGGAQYIQESLKLIFGKDCRALQEHRIFGAQTVGGTGALRIGGEFLAQEGIRELYLSEPSWPNHPSIFRRAGMEIHSYPYYDRITNRLDFKGMCDAVRAMPPKSVILLQGCCHNPTGMDPSEADWRKLSELVRENQLIPFFDLAYQGFRKDLENDAYAVRLFAEEGHEMFVASSFSKNFGLYGERVGLISVVTRNPETSKRVGSQIRQIIRGNYSSPPLHGQAIISTILSDPELHQEWEHELSNIRGRITEMRKGLVAGLLAKCNNADYDFMHQQIGMFSFSGLTPDQVHRLRQEYGIYMTESGRINVAGLNWNNLDYVIDAISTLHNEA